MPLFPLKLLSVAEKADIVCRVLEAVSAHALKEELLVRVADNWRSRSSHKWST